MKGNKMSIKRSLSSKPGPVEEWGPHNPCTAVGYVAAASCMALVSIEHRVVPPTLEALLLLNHKNVVYPVAYVSV